MIERYMRELDEAELETYDIDKIMAQIEAEAESEPVTYSKNTKKSASKSGFKNSRL